MQGRPGEEVMRHIRQLKPPYKVTFVVQDDDSDILDFRRFTQGYYDPPEPIPVQLFNFVFGCLATLLLSLYIFLPLLDLIFDIVLLFYMSSMEYWLTSLVITVMSIRGTILIHVLVKHGQMDFDGPMYELVFFFLPLSMFLLNTCILDSNDKMHMSSLVLEDFPGATCHFFWVVSLCCDR
eukprot:UN25528